ncbi:hypothetical protein [Roseateles noduli]|uniref:hypothetical protein n=1 Tax=Roseateles noduli TaxID=2052484 RepID=UPI003D654521
MSVPSETIKIVGRRGDSRAVINDSASKEIIFAVVGPAGSGTTFIAQKLVSAVGSILQTAQVTHIKASSVIAATLAEGALDGIENMERAKLLQDAGDLLRKDDEAAIGSLLTIKIKEEREKFKAASDKTNVASLRIDESNSAPRVYVIDSLKHPAEVELLRAVYREAFCLIGVVCEEDARKERLKKKKWRSSSSDQVDEFIKRDEDGSDR